MPVIGEYRHQYTQRNIALSAGYQESQIIILENGQVATFEDGILVSRNETVAHGDVLVDGSMVGDINEIVLRDREMLAQEGLVIVTVVVDLNKEKIVSEPVVVAKGLIISDSLDHVLAEVGDLTAEMINSALKTKFVDWSEVKDNLHDKITKRLYGITKKNPIVMPTIINV